MVTTTMILIRRCVLSLTILGLVACSSIKQTPNQALSDSSSDVVKSVESFKPKPEITVTKITVIEVETTVVSQQQETPVTTDKDQELAEYISDKFKAPLVFSKEVVALATKFAYSDFPKREDILAIIAVESGFRPKVSYRGSHGLMQIEKKSHSKSLQGRNIHNPAVNIELGSKILHEYYLALDRSIRNTVLAYNAGIGNFLRQRYHLVYYKKYTEKVSLISKKQ